MWDSSRLLAKEANRMEKDFLDAFFKYRVRYKVLTKDRKSTGLMHSSIVQYRLKKWNHPDGKPIRGKCGEGGLWASRNRSMARLLQRYLKEKHQMETNIHLCFIDQILFESGYRTKTNRLFLLDEIK